MIRKESCPQCGGSPVREVVARRESLVGRWTAEFEDRFCACDACGEEFYDPEQADASFRKAADSVRAKVGLVPPERIRALRERYGLSQAQLERLLGIGAKMVVRWERGTVLPSLAASRLIEVLDDVPVAVFIKLAAKRGVVPKRGGGREGAA